MLKHILVLVLACACITSAIEGQQNTFSIGIETGPSIISLEQEGDRGITDLYHTAPGFSAGLSSQYLFSDRFAIHLGVAYERKGALLKIVVTDANGESLGIGRTHVNYNYITMPLLMRVSGGSKLRYYLNAGPYVGYLLKLTHVTEAIGPFPEITEDFTDSSKRVDAGIVVGAGVGIPLKEEITLSFEVRHNRGLTDIVEAPTTVIREIRTRSTGLLIGIHFTL